MGNSPEIIFPLPPWEGCGGYLHADRGFITSPQFPDTYSPDLNCSWHVLVHSGLTIAVHFDQPFEIPNADASCSQGDYLVVSLALAGPAVPKPKWCFSPPGTGTGTDFVLHLWLIGFWAHESSIAKAFPKFVTSNKPPISRDKASFLVTLY